MRKRVWNLPENKHLWKLCIDKIDRNRADARKRAEKQNPWKTALSLFNKTTTPGDAGEGEV